MKERKYYGDLLVLATTIIYGVNTPLMKSILPEWIDAWALTSTRQAFAAVLFWITSFFFPSEKISRKHIFYIAAGALFGLALNQLPYALGLTLSSPVDASILRSFTPVFVIILSVIFFRKKLSVKLIGGVLIGICGAILIILFGGSGKDNSMGHLYGNLLVVIGIASFSIYLVLIKRVVSSYHPIHVMKWLFLFATLFTLPFSYKHILEAKAFSGDADWTVIVRIGYVYVFSTYLAYFLNLKALKYISSTRESLYSYLQPVVATFIAIMIGQDTLSWVDPVSLSLIFLSFYIINHKKNGLTVPDPK